MDTISANCVPDREPSLLPEGREWRLVFHDEFDGDALDASKWSYRMHFWGRRAPWFAAPEDGAGECIWTMINTDRLKPIPITFSYPYLLLDAPWLTTLVNVHSAPSPETQRVLVRLLYGELPFCGKSPFRQSINLGVQE